MYHRKFERIKQFLDKARKTSRKQLALVSWNHDETEGQSVS